MYIVLQELQSLRNFINRAADMMYLGMEFFVGAKKHNSSVINYPQDVLRNIGAI